MHRPKHGKDEHDSSFPKTFLAWIQKAQKFLVITIVEGAGLIAGWLDTGEVVIKNVHPPTEGLVCSP